MAEFQILDRVLAAGSQLLKLGSVDAVSAQVPSLSATLAVLETIVRTVGVRFSESSRRGTEENLSRFSERAGLQRSFHRVVRGRE